MTSEGSLIFGSFGCLFAIIVLIICEAHSIFYYLRNRSNIEAIQKKTMLLELIMIVLFMFPTVCTICFKHNYFRPYHQEKDFSQIECKLSMVLLIAPYFCGKTILYTLFIYRIYKTFEHSIFHIDKHVPYILITLQSLTIIPFFVSNVINVFHKDNHVVVQSVGNVLKCDLEYSDDHPTITLIMLVLPILNMLIEIVVCVYLIYIFSSRLNKLRAALYAIEVRENVNELGQVHTASEIDVQAVECDVGSSTGSDGAKRKKKESKETIDLAKDEAMKLRAITIKQTVLGVLALSSSLIFYVYSMIVRSPDFVGWDIIINALSIHLMFSYSQFICDKLFCKH